MYICNFAQESTVANFYENWDLIAADDDTPIQNDQCIVRVQMWARSARGMGDQSQFYANWPYIYGGGYAAVPSFSAATNDGTGLFTLNDGVLELNIPYTTMQKLSPGYYELGMTIATPDGTFIQQLAVGVVPILNGGVWSY